MPLPLIRVPDVYNKNRFGRYRIPTNYVRQVSVYSPEVWYTVHFHDDSMAVVSPYFWDVYNKANGIIQGKNAEAETANKREVEAETAKRVLNPRIHDGELSVNSDPAELIHTVNVLKSGLKKRMRSIAPVGKASYDFFENILHRSE